MYHYSVVAAEVVDGDTVDLTIDVGFRHTFRDRFRLFGPDPESKMGLNAPEINTPEGVASREFLKEVLAEAMTRKAQIIVRTLKDKREKYGRWLAILIIEDKHTVINVNRLMIEAGYATLKAYGETPGCPKAV